jgi:hypothetical protein
MNAAIQIAVLVLGAIFALAGIALFAKRGISGQNTIKIAGVEFQLAGSSLVVFVVGCMLIVIAARMQTSSREEIKSPTATGSPLVPPAGQATPFGFTAQYIYRPERIERTEYETETESGQYPKETIDDFLRLTSVALGGDGARVRNILQITVTLKNTKKDPIFLDLTERFFSLDDNAGNAATLLYFCCASRPGELLSPGQEREIQLFFQGGHWSGKHLAAQWIFFHVQGLLPVVRGTWKMRTLATAD